jgi:hypothetical protein
MESYSKNAAETYQLKGNNDWMRRRQGLALPVLPPTTLEARKYFFSQAPRFAAIASAEGKGKINYEAFAREWNQSADGKSRFYVTTEVLASYAKTWEKTNNIRASEELVADKMDLVSKTRKIFAAPYLPFPEYLADNPVSVQPSKGVIDFDEPVPFSLSTDLPTSRPCADNNSTRNPSPLPIYRPELAYNVGQVLSQDFEAPPASADTMTYPPEPYPPMSEPLQASMTPVTAAAGTATNPTSSNEEHDLLDSERPTKRRRVVPVKDRKRALVRKCRRCKRTECSGNSDILKCNMPCTVPCSKYKQLQG